MPTTLLFFFFQAEDGIRDKLVTGVQTCALPISLGASASALRRTLLAESLLLCGAGAILGVLIARPMVAILARYAARFSVRSEERRVGKECRSRRSPCYEKKNKRDTGMSNNEVAV